jgi:hypothetical protein
VNVLLRKLETQQAAVTPATPAPAPDTQPASQPAAQPPAQGAGAGGGKGVPLHLPAAAFKVHDAIGQAAEHLQLAAKAVELKAPAAEMAVAALPDRTEIYRSGPQVSGAGKNFSVPYDLCSGDPPSGYVIKSNRFLLAGDRQCDRWATCKETRNEATKVCWQFSLQGHEEQTGFFKPGQTGQAYSEGVLTVVWTRGRD